MDTDIAIARSVALRPIATVADDLGIPDAAIEPYGRYKAKIALDWLQTRQGGAKGRLILVTAINPTPAGEGKTTTSIGLADALRHTGRKAVLALREPSLGPCFGTKGGATDKRCLIEAHIPQHAPVAVSHQAPSLDQAFRGAETKALSALDSVLGKEKRHRDRTSIRTDPEAI